VATALLANGAAPGRNAYDLIVELPTVIEVAAILTRLWLVLSAVSKSRTTSGRKRFVSDSTLTLSTICRIFGNVSANPDSAEVKKGVAQPPAKSAR
jgi:hypothetical protein